MAIVARTLAVAFALAGAYAGPGECGVGAGLCSSYSSSAATLNDESKLGIESKADAPGFEAGKVAQQPRAGIRTAVASSSSSPRPHIVVALFDDLGYHDLGAFQEDVKRHRCATPVMDHLSSTGVKLSNFYSMPICSPTRGALLSGRYPIRYGGTVGTPPGLAADQGWVPLDEPMLAERLREAGYSTKMSGKVSGQHKHT